MGRILWIPAFQPGSYFPAVPIALELAARGHDVTVLCEAVSESTFSSLGFDFRPATSLDEYLGETNLRGADRTAKLRWHAGYARALFADATRELAAGRYDGVMVDPLEPGADFAAEAAGVPSFSYVHWAMDETGADVPFCFHLWDRQRPPAEAFVEWWNEQRALVGLDPEPRPPTEHRWYRHSRSLTLILRLPELVDPKGQLPPYAVRVGPLVWDPPYDRALPAWVDSLGRQRPAILASVSTVGQADTELILTLAEAARNEDVDVVATIAPAHDLPELPPNVRLAPFVPHSALIDRVSLVACHAGNGTVTRAACAGVPLLLFPDGRDRFQVARGAAAAGVAIVIERARCDATVTRQAIRMLLDDPQYARRASKLAQVAGAYTAAATAASQIEALLRSPRHAKRAQLNHARH